MAEQWKAIKQHGTDVQGQYIRWIVIKEGALPVDVIVEFPREAPDQNGNGLPEIEARANLVAWSPDLLRQRDELLAVMHGIVLMAESPIYIPDNAVQGIINIAAKANEAVARIEGGH